MSGCIFCAIGRGELPAEVVFEDDAVRAILDHRPVFPGHVLLMPKDHIETLPELPEPLHGPFMAAAARLGLAVRDALEAQGTFMGINNVVSQSVPHLHLHIVPRRKGDGLRGFFWPRVRYADGEMEQVAHRIRAAVRS